MRVILRNGRKRIEVAVDDRVLIVIADEGDIARHELPNASTARAEFDALVATAQKRGFVLEEPEEEEAPREEIEDLDGDGIDDAVSAEEGERVAVNPELEAAILRDPDDKATYEVYGDWLIGQNDPRGKLIAFQCHADRNRAPGEIPAEMRYRSLNAWALLGPDHELVAGWLHWRYGFVREVRAPGSGESVRMLAGVLALPVCRFLQRVSVSFADPGIASSIVKAPGDSVRELALTGADLPGLGAIWKTLRALRSVSLGAEEVELGDLDLPEVQELELDVRVPGDAFTRAFHLARCPQLTRLRLRGGDWLTAGILKPILDRDLFPKLRALELPRCENGDEIVRAVLSSRLLPQLEVLDFARATVDAGVFEDERLAHLGTLELGGIEIDDALRERIEAVVPGLECSDVSEEENAFYDEDDEDEPDEDDERYDEIEE